VKSLVLSAAVAVALGVAAPALASSRRAGPRSQQAAAAPYSRGGVPTQKSTTFAGYEVNHKDGETDISTTIVVPKLKCTKALRAIGASVGMFEDSTKHFSSANLFIGCVNGKPRYFPFVTVHQHETNFMKTAAHAGDTVVLEARATTTETTVSVIDETHSFSRTKAGAGYSRLVAYPWIGDVTWSTNGGVLRVPDFGEITFSHSTAGGKPFGAVSPQERFNRYSANKARLQIKTSPYASDNESFSTVFKHS
jgi:hypothetical protein